MFGMFQFDVDNYSEWKFRILALLGDKDLVDYMKDDESANDGTQTWVKGIRKAKSLIIRCVASSHLEYIRDKAPAHTGARG